MKKITLISSIVWMLCSLAAAAQNISEMQPASIPSYAFTVTYDKTSNIVFPFSIVSVDRGSVAVLVQKAHHADNVLQLKAGKRNFAATNVTVITSDGRLYPFNIQYTDRPQVLNWSFVGDSLTSAPVGKVLFTEAVNEAALQKTAERVAQAKPFMHYRARRQKLSLILRGIYQSGNALWYSLELKNNAGIAFSSGYVRFVVCDKKQSRRTATQERELKPLYHDPLKKIQGYDSSQLIYGLPQVSMPKSKILRIEVGDSSGGWSVILKLKSRHLLRSKPL